MSESEKKQRAAYQKGRSKQITVRSIIVIVLTVALLLCALSARSLSQNQYVTYTESGSVDYKVNLKNNSFYNEGALDENHAYVSSLVKDINAEFSYDMQVATQVEYNYSYYVDARLEVQDSETGAAIFDPVYELVAPKTASSSNQVLRINQPVTIEYNRYNNIAQQFVNTYGLKDAKSSLIVTLHVNIEGSCPDAPANQGEYTVDLRIPLNQTTLKIESNSSVPTAEAKVLACNNRSATAMLILSVLLAIADLVCIVLLLRYMILTRDRHINYARCVKKILSSYRSYVQKIKNPFNAENYQVLNVVSFEELLEIRDTLQKPILMYENPDRTCTKFFIPSDNGLCYAYKICVAGVHSADM